ncbi:MAG: hypothetical protein KGJ23_08580 [Euryarchaeota archaeon]|nr:hypothetical protein [Euryarchaeota archaeon]MDE1836658.1 hypothetical protein [Euryarchaeota archaeon]MDE1880313.1 hypothetical protein [Euryarchaeota archaeon]MDE2044628.1 hypothetical protein [Thermoplasmata archaeon]
MAEAQRKSGQPISLDEVWDETERLQTKFWGPHGDLSHYLVSLVSEVGEVADLIKRADHDGTRGTVPLDMTRMLEEIADVQAYITILVQRLGVSREDFALAWAEKMAKVERKMLAREAPR